MRKLLFIGIALGILVGCGSDEPESNQAEQQRVAATAETETKAERTVRAPAEKPATPKKVSGDISDRVRNQHWRLVALNGAEPTGAAWLEIDGRTNTLAGFLGCNQVRGKVYSEYEQLKISRLRSMENDCESELNREEGVLFAALSALDFSEFDGDQLVLGGDGQEMVFRARETSR